MEADVEGDGGEVEDNVVVVDVVAEVAVVLGPLEASGGGIPSCGK